MTPTEPLVPITLSQSGGSKITKYVVLAVLGSIAIAVVIATGLASAIGGAFNRFKKYN